MSGWETRALEAEGAVRDLGAALEECRARVAELEIELLLSARADRDRLEPLTELNCRLRERIAEIEAGPVSPTSALRRERTQ